MIYLLLAVAMAAFVSSKQSDRTIDFLAKRFSEETLETGGLIYALIAIGFLLYPLAMYLLTSAK